MITSIKFNAKSKIFFTFFILINFTITNALILNILSKNLIFNYQIKFHYINIAFILVFKEL